MNNRGVLLVLALIALIGILSLASSGQQVQPSVEVVSTPENLQVLVQSRISIDPGTNEPVSWNTGLSGVVVNNINWDQLGKNGWSEATVVSSEDPLHRVGDTVEVANYFGNGYTLVFRDSLVVERIRTYSSVQPTLVTSEYQIYGVEVESVDWFNLREHGWSYAVVVKSGGDSPNPGAVVTITSGVGANGLALTYSESLTFAISLFRVGMQIVDKLGEDLAQ